MIFDSDVLIWLSRKNHEAIRWIDSTPDRALSVVTLMEVLQGARSRADMRKTQESLRNLGFRVLPLSERIGHIAAGLIEEYSLAHGLQMPDALIAATAIETGEVLATANVRHFRPIRRLAWKPFRPRRA